MLIELLFIMLGVVGLFAYLLKLRKLQQNPSNPTELQQCPQCRQPLTGAVKSLKPFLLEFRCKNQKCPLFSEGAD